MDLFFADERFLLFVESILEVGVHRAFHEVCVCQMRGSSELSGDGVVDLGDDLASKYVDLLNERDEMLRHNHCTDCVNFDTFMDEIQTYQEKTYTNSDDDEDIAEFDEVYTDE